MPRKYKAQTPTGTVKSNLPTGQGYGVQGGEARSLQAMPAPRPADPVANAPVSATANTPAGGGMPAPSPVDVAAATPFTPVGLGDPSKLPGEPVTAGLPSGPGSNAPTPLIAPQTTGAADPTLQILLAAQRAFPNPGIEQLISRYQVLNGPA